MNVRATQEEEPEADPKADKGKAKDEKGKKGKKDEPEEEELPLLQELRNPPASSIMEGNRI